MLIRVINRSDKPSWLAMRTALWPEMKQDHEIELDQFFANESIDIEEVFIIEIDDEVIGFIELNIRDFAEGSRNSRVPYVEAWYIKPDFQNKGYGTKLMLQAEQWALSKGFDELASDTEIDNAHSIALHQKLGFTETYRIVCFLKSLKNS